MLHGNKSVMDAMAGLVTDNGGRVMQGGRCATCAGVTMMPAPDSTRLYLLASIVGKPGMYRRRDLVVVIV